MDVSYDWLSVTDTATSVTWSRSFIRWNDDCILSGVHCTKFPRWFRLVSLLSATGVKRWWHILAAVSWKFQQVQEQIKKKKMTDWFGWVNAASFCFRLPSIESWMIVIDLKKTGFTNNYDIMKEYYHPLRWSGDRWWCWLRCNDYHKVAALSDFKTRLRSIKIFPRQFALKSLRLCSKSDKNQFASFQLSSLEIWIEWVNS